MQIFKNIFVIIQCAKPRPLPSSHSDLLFPKWKVAFKKFTLLPKHLQAIFSWLMCLGCCNTVTLKHCYVHCL